MAIETSYDASHTALARASRETFGVIHNAIVEAITLRNRSGASVRILTYGAIVQAVHVPDRSGRLDDVVLGYDSLDEYQRDPYYMGALVGRYANRIAGGRFVLDGKTHELSRNDRANHLHGGPTGFHTRVFEAELLESTQGTGVRLAYTSPDGEEGFPGTLAVTVTYTWTDANELIMECHAVTDQATHVNLTQHSYFNLRGHTAGEVLEHELTIDGDQVIAVDDACLPVEMIPVAHTPFDFTERRAIARNYDHCFALRDQGGALKRAALLHEPMSGRTLEVLTTEPGVQLYTGQFLQSITGKANGTYAHHSGVCLETQHYPDSPNHPEWPSTLLRPSERYATQTVFRFGCAG